MSAVAELTDALMAAGMTAGQAAALLARAHAEIAAPTRSKGAIRTERWRNNKASQTVTERHTVTLEKSEAETSPSVTNRHQASQCDAAHIYTLSPLNSEDSSKEESKKEGPSKKRASRIPDDWTLDQKHIDYAISKGVAPERVPIIAEKFKNHWLSASGKGSVSPNWFLKWCTWVMNEIEWNGTKNGRTQADKSVVAGADRILERMRSFDRPINRS